MDDIRAIDKPLGKKVAKPHSIPILVLGANKSSGSGLNPCFLWDNCGYLLGYKGVTEEKEKKRIREAFSSFRDKHLAVESSVNHPHFSAVCRFLGTMGSRPDAFPAALSRSVDIQRYLPYHGRNA